MSLPYSITGFYKAPVSKALIVLGSALSTSLLFLGPRRQNYFVYSNDFLFGGQELWRLITCKLAFHEVHSLLLGVSLVYHFRILERRYGSAKFTSYLLANTLLCIGVEVAAVFILEALEYKVLPHTLCGPQSVLFSLFVPFFLDIPNVSTQNNFMAEVMAGKWFSYVLGIYLTTLTHTTPLAIAYGIIAGILYRTNLLYIKSWMRVPKILSSLCHKTLGWLLSSRPPREGAVPMGATLEIQRQQRMELLEQRMLMAQAQRFRAVQRQNAIRRPIRQTFPLRRPEGGGHSPHRQTNMGARVPNGGATSPPANGSTLPAPDSTSPPAPQPSSQDLLDMPSTSRGTGGDESSSVLEDRIQQLVDMGFNRGAVMQALRMSNNDVNTATTVLLQE